MSYLRFLQFVKNAFVLVVDLPKFVFPILIGVVARFKHVGLEGLAEDFRFDAHVSWVILGPTTTTRRRAWTETKMVVSEDRALEPW